MPWKQQRETDIETAKVKKIRWKLCFKWIGFMTTFSPGLATAFSHAAGIYWSLCLKWKGEFWGAKTGQSRGQEVQKSAHTALPYGLAFLPSRGQSEALSATLNDPFMSHQDSGMGQGLQYCTGLKCPWIKIQDHSCSWGWAGRPQPGLAVSSCGQGAQLSSETIEWVGTGASTKVGNGSAGKPARQGSVSENGWRNEGPLPPLGRRELWRWVWEDRILDSNCRSWPMKLMLTRPRSSSAWRNQRRSFRWNCLVFMR